MRILRWRGGERSGRSLMDARRDDQRVALILPYRDWSVHGFIFLFRSGYEFFIREHIKKIKGSILKFNQSNFPTWKIQGEINCVA